MCVRENPVDTLGKQMDLCLQLDFLGETLTGVSCHRRQDINSISVQTRSLK